jgi:predicted 3-demethylubiquinone-9 3-methyltransferase (glyoxalase superfamily)
MPDKISPCLWFDGQAEEAANFYISVFKDGSIDRISYFPEERPEEVPFEAGKAMLVEFTLFGQSYQGLNGGPQFPFTEAVSMSLLCKDQAELDRYYDALVADGGKPNVCGWLQDKYGLSWQLIPEAWNRMIGSGDTAAIARMMKELWSQSKLDVAALEAAFAGETV